MKTSYMAKPADVVRSWHLIDATNMPLGRLATAVTDLLSGKLKPTFTPHVDSGDFVVVINTDKMVLTGNKLKNKFYRHHSGYAGGLKETNYQTLMEKDSPKALQVAVKGMLRKNSHGRKQVTRLFAYAGAEHNQQAQKPVAYAVKGARE